MNAEILSNPTSRKFHVEPKPQDVILYFRHTLSIVTCLVYLFQKKLKRPLRKERYHYEVGSHNNLISTSYKKQTKLFQLY